MTKQILISIHPEHAVNILNGKKTLELRTWIPKGYVGWVNVYVTKGVGKSKYHHLYNLTKYNNGKTLFSITHHNKHSLVPDGFLNGKVVARFWFDEYDEFDSTLGNPRIYVNACVDDKYAIKHFNGKKGYAWHISKLEIFDKPKELSEFKLTKAPQRMAWVYGKE